MTKVSQALFNEYKGLADQLASALDNRDQIAVTQINAKITAWALANKVDLTQVVEVDTTPVPATDPGVVKPGGWGASTDAKTWKVVNMTKTPAEFKVVDDKGVNVATNFKTQAGAQAYIDAHKGVPVPPVPPGPSTGGVDQFGIKKIFADKPGGKVETAFKLEEKMRNYASGKPSEWSTEYTNVSPAVVQNVEVTIYEKINGFKKEADTISLKLGGPDHQDGARFWVIPDFSTTGDPSRTLEIEDPHPQNHGINPKPLSDIGGSIVGKWFGYKGISYQTADGKRHVESWVHFPVTNIDTVTTEQANWRKYITYETEAKYHTFLGKNTTSRLDGVTKGDPPTFKFASLREIQA